MERNAIFGISIGCDVESLMCNVGPKESSMEME